MNERLDQLVIDEMRQQGYLPTDEASQLPADQDAYQRNFYAMADHSFIVFVTISGRDVLMHKKPILRQHLVRARCASCVLDAVIAKVKEGPDDQS